MESDVSLNTSLMLNQKEHDYVRLLYTFTTTKIIFQKFFNLNSQKQLRLRFSEEAQKIYTEWMINNHKNASCDIHPALESHFLKMPKTIATLALIFEIIIKLSNDDIIQDSLNYLVDYGYLNSADIPTTDGGGSLV